MLVSGAVYLPLLLLIQLAVISELKTLNNIKLEFINENLQ